MEKETPMASGQNHTVQNKNVVLITCVQNLSNCCSLVAGNKVEVWIDGQCVESQKVACKERYDRTKMNAVGMMGAVIKEPDIDRLKQIAHDYAEKYQLPVVENTQPVYS